jgi:aspartyl-tRNA(Asn)/glutamyl-tRNA(Gln) amidotransferase subunit C
MAVKAEDVKQVAALARLDVTASEVGRLTGELNRILEYMEKLNELNTDSVEPTSHVIPVTNAFRADVAKVFPDTEALRDAAPQSEAGYFKVPRIID